MSEDTITIAVPQKVSVQSIKDLLCNAIEGGSNYWVKSIDRMGGITREQAEYRQDVPFIKGGWLELVELGDDGQSDGRLFSLHKETLIEGLHIMAQKYPEHFEDFLNDNADATTGDVFLQLCCFQEIIYG